MLWMNNVLLIASPLDCRNIVTSNFAIVNSLIQEFTAIRKYCFDSRMIRVLKQGLEYYWMAIESVGVFTIVLALVLKPDINDAIETNLKLGVNTV